MAVVSMLNSLTLGTSKDLLDYYRKPPGKEAMVERQKQLMRPIKTSLREIKEPLKESIPFPELWPLGTPRGFKTFKDRLLTYTHRNWNLALPYSRWDEEDEVHKGDLQTHLQGMAGRFRQLLDQQMVDYMLATATLGQSLDLAFDGAGLFSATDGDGNARFGATGGNLISKTIANEADFIDALQSVEQRMLLFKDTESQPFFTPDECEMSKFVVCVGPALVKIARKVQAAKYIAADPNIPAASENIAVQNFDLWVNPRFTATSTRMCVFLKHEYYKPFAHIQRTSGPEIQRADQSNWDRALEIGEFALMGHTREAVSIFGPHAAVLVA